jgi:hypothetical protein
MPVMQEPSARQRACREFISNQNEDYGKHCPIKNLTFSEVQSVLEWLDSNRPGRDKNFWFKGFGAIDVDVAWDFFMPAVAKVLPQCVKRGHSLTEVSAVTDPRKPPITRPVKVGSGDAFEFLVQGSAPEPYMVSFQRRSPKNISAYCTCPAGENGMACKHRIRIFRGSIEGIVSKNTADVAIVAGWIAGSDVETALQAVDELQKEFDRISKALSTAKKALAKCFMD